MESLQSIKRRIKGVGNINQITKAMELVAATKMRLVTVLVGVLRSGSAGCEKGFGAPDASPPAGRDSVSGAETEAGSGEAEAILKRGAGS